MRPPPRPRTRRHVVAQRHYPNRQIGDTRVTVAVQASEYGRFVARRHRVPDILRVAMFEVGEYYSVTDIREVSSRAAGQRQGQAQAHRDFIRHRVAHLVANDRFITDQLKETTANFGNLIFEEPPAAKERGSGAADGIPLGFHDFPEGRIVWCVLSAGRALGFRLRCSLPERYYRYVLHGRGRVRRPPMTVPAYSTINGGGSNR